MALNESQRRRVSATFSYVDALLRSVEHLTAGELSPFAPERPDLNPVEVHLVDAVVRGVRDRMLLALDRFGIPRPQANVSARWSLETTLKFAGIACAELNEGTLRGYGALAPEDAASVAAVVTDLERALSRGRGLLRGGNGAELAGTLRAIPGEVGAILRALEHASTTHGLVEIRAGLAAAAERAVADTFDVGIFGRVGSGKSSLINALVTRPILPVGATPVTAVPVRIRRGPDGIAITFVDGRRESAPLDRLAEFATEESNPDNARDVAAVEVTVPEMLPGLLLLDTPGVGSLALGGAARAYAWLPRCDLGIVLVSAGSPLGTDEQSLLAALLGAGIDTRVMLSKADLLSEPERARALSYLERELARLTPASRVPVAPASARPESAALLDRWRNDVLAPLVAARREAAARALRRRLETLVRVAAAELAGRSAILDSGAIARETARRDAYRQITDSADRLDGVVPDVLERAAHAAVEAWKKGGDGRQAAAQEMQAIAWDALSAIRRAADQDAEGSGQNSAAPVGEAGTRLPPVFDTVVLGELPVTDRPGALDRLLGWRRVRRRLEPIAGELGEAYRRYGSRLRDWGIARLEEHGRQDAIVPAGEAAAALTPEFAALLSRVRALEPTSSRPAA